MKCICGNTIEVRVYQGKRAKSYTPKYCNRKCFYNNRKRPSGLTYVITAPNKGWFKPGKAPSDKAIAASRLATTKSPTDKGYDAKHDWVEKNYGKPRECEKCGTTKAKVFQWSNKSGKYILERSDWQRLCAKCHMRYDYDNFGLRKSFYEK